MVNTVNYQQICTTVSISENNWSLNSAFRQKDTDVRYMYSFANFFLSLSPHTYIHTHTLQLVELRQRADEYRTRAQRVHFPPYHLSIHHHDNTDQDSSVTTSSMTSPLPSDDQTPTETSSPTPDSMIGMHVSGDFVDQTQSQHLSQNQGCLGFGKSQKTHQVAQVFSKTTAPLGKRVVGDGGHA